MQTRILRELVIPILLRKFGEKQFVVGVDEQIAIFPPAHRDFGELSILDDGNEVTVSVGRLTHTHFGPVEDVSVTADVEETILRPLIEFLEDLLADRLLVWCVPGKCAGYQDVSDETERVPKEAMTFVWSGPCRALGS
jgi:hypothetical protein